MGTPANTWDKIKAGYETKTDSSKKFEEAVRSFACSECKGWGVVSQSPTNPAGDTCEGCEGLGFGRNGEIFSDAISGLMSAHRRASQELVREARIDELNRLREWEIKLPGYDVHLNRYITERLAELANLGDTNAK